MFYCKVGGHVSKPGERKTFIVMAQRRVTNVHSASTRVGFETAVEIAACPGCVVAGSSLRPQVVDVTKRVVHP